MKSVLTIAGSDSGGGAGIQADLKTFAANGVYGASVITAITAQNTLGVFGIEALSPEIIEAQLEAVFSDLKIDGVKVGMVADEAIIKLIAAALKKGSPPVVVVDPVMVSTTGHTLLQPNQIHALKTLLLPLATLITPNIQEAEVLLDRKITTFDEMKQACTDLADEVGTLVLLKGGHFPVKDGEHTKSVDVLSTGEFFERDWIVTGSTHGTGCSLSSAICANLAKGTSLPVAIEKAKAFVHEGIAQSFKVGEGANPIHHFHALWKDGFMETLQDCFKQLKEKAPFVHHITNSVTTNDCANTTLAVGGRPAMAPSPEEVQDMVANMNALVLNTGTLTREAFESMLLAGKKANELGIPVILDPVAVGATPFRKELNGRLVAELEIAVIRGNASEIMTLAGVASGRGVDVETGLVFDEERVMAFARESKIVLATSGEVDFVTDGVQKAYISNGVATLSEVTGTGCMSTSIIGSLLGAGNPAFESAVLGTAMMGVAGELAETAVTGRKLGSFKVALMDALSAMDEKTLENYGRVRHV
ncbi:MAG: bifunctional hydroxymethylpyrimidine kinase/phosphomethylpyrimidine kinase [Turicibacter sp.]|nr:bifunctional hydroxymethylpyrimidine kinase/phosphomethylpyrimidine kinase [Turicibacter sp.]